MAIQAKLPKDIVTRVRQLASEATRSEGAFDRAQQQYDRATKGLIQTARDLAIQLYAIAVDYADRPEAIDAELTRLSIRVKQSSSVYIRICRLAFEDENTSEEASSRVSRYADLIGRAHASGMSKDHFATLASAGITAALRNLTGEAAEPVQIGRKEAEKLLGREVELEGIKLGVADGTELQLLARYQGGRVVLYGIVPPAVSDTLDVLKRIGGKKLSEARKLGDVFPEILRTIKLVGSASDTHVASYSVGRSAAQFVMEKDAAVAVLSFPKNLDFASGSTISLPAKEWGQVCASIVPFFRQPMEASFDGKKLVVRVAGLDGEPLRDWLHKKNKKRPQVGDTIEDRLEIPISSTNVATSTRQPKLKSSFEFSQAQLAPLLGLKVTAGYVGIELGDAGIKTKVAKSKGKTGDFLSRKSLRVVKSAASKLLRLSATNSLQTSCEGGYFGISTTVRDFSFSVFVPMA